MTQHKYSLVPSAFSTSSSPPSPSISSPPEPWKLLPTRKFLLIASLSIALPILFARILFPSPSPSPVTVPPDLPFPSADADSVPPPPDLTSLIDFTVGGCNIWHGEWIPDSAGPAYTNLTCFFIQEHQNCQKNGRPDLGYLYWRWKPKACDLPYFDAKTYLTIVSGKSWAFIGDSIARNHFQSFLCSLAKVEVPVNVYKDEMDRNVRWHFQSYNFTLAIIWAPFLVVGTEEEAEGFAQGIEKLHLDEIDPSWKTSMGEYDYIVLSSGQWYLKKSVYFVGGEVIGGHGTSDVNVTEIGFYGAYRKALRTVFNKVVGERYKGVAFFRTFTPDHFENGRWDNGGNCTRTEPYGRGAVAIEGMTAEMYKIQLEEFGRAMAAAEEMGVKLQIVDTIHASILRPDAHPGPYRNFQPFAHDKHAKVQNDCLHWCLPGAIDTWSAMLLHVLRHV